MKRRVLAAVAALLLMMAGGAARADAAIELTGDGAMITGTGAAFADGVLSITEAGTYAIRGTLEGQIAVYAGKNGAVTLELAGVDIRNETGAAIDAMKTGTLTIELASGTENRLQSGAQMPEENDDEAESIACISTKDDLVIAGEGALTVLGYLGGGIKASNALTIAGGRIDVTAARIGIKGKDSVTITGGEIAIASGHDGIQADAEDGEGYGVVNVAGGVLSITSGGDAIQAETALNVTGGEIVAVTGGGSENATGARDDGGFSMRFGGFGGFGGGRGGMRGETAATDGEADAQSEAFEPRGEGGQRGEPPEGVPDDVQMPRGEPEREADAQTDEEMQTEGAQAEAWTLGDDDQSTKGLKSNGAMTITGGTITIDAQDDALHAAGDIVIGGGTLELASGDDGVHSDALLHIDAGSVTVTRSHEGLEGWSIAIEGGDVRVTADDDGLNASGDGGTAFFWRGGQAQDAEEDAARCELRIAGGTLTVDAQGDGLDSNGDLIIEGGTVIVNGPTQSMNGALDSGSESGGACRVTGGTVLALGAAGMAEGFDETSTQVSLITTMGQTLRAGDVLRILSEDGDALIEHTLTKDAQSVVFSCPQLAIGQTVILEAGDVREDVTLDAIASGERSGGWGRGWR